MRQIQTIHHPPTENLFDYCLEPKNGSNYLPAGIESSPSPVPARQLSVRTPYPAAFRKQQEMFR